MPLYPSRAILAAVVLRLAASPAGAAGAAAGAELPSFQSRDVVHAAKAAPAGAKLRLENVRVAETGEAAAFVLERFEVFAADARITIHGKGGDQVLPAPAHAYFRGAVEGRPGSRVFLAVHEDGTAQGLVSEPEEMYLIGGDELAVKAVGAPLEMQRVDPVMLKSARNSGFTCANDHLPPGPRALEELGFLATVGADATPLAEAAAAAYTARVAIETDFEYLQRFSGNTTAATDYVGNLIGYASSVYAAEVNTSLVVQSVSLWTTSSDPWNQTSSTCGLMEFGRYWNLNKTGVSRTIAHFLSGKAVGGGVAWLGVLCSGAFGTSASCPGLATDAPWGGAYGFTGSIAGNFNINNPTVVWDIMAVSHEIGHNFNSPHTHCYNGIGGSASPVDQCRTGEGGCYVGTQSLPGPAGSGSGTIMSYCHLMSPGMSNISMTFGTNHPYGVLPGRVPSRMLSHVQSRAASSPACLAPAAAAPAAIFADSFEGGALPGAWNGGKTP